MRPIVRETGPPCPRNVAAGLPPMEVNLDGEIAAMTPATFEVDRNALHVVVPAHGRAARMDDTSNP